MKSNLITQILAVFALTFISNVSAVVAQVTPLNDVAENLLQANISANGITYPYSFIAMGDNRGSSASVTQEFLDILYEISLETSFDTDDITPSFIINCGDLVPEGTAAQYNLAQGYHTVVNAFMQGTNIPFFSLPGNHEFISDPNGLANYHTYVDADLDYTFDYGNSRFLLMNNVFQDYPVVSSADRVFSQAQLDQAETWIDQGTGKPNVFSFSHIPLYAVNPSYSGSGDLYSNDGYSEFVDLLKSKPSTKAHFAGHRHYYEHPHISELGHVEHFTTGSCGSYIQNVNGVSGQAEGFIDINSNHEAIGYFHYLLVTVTDCDEIEVEMHVLGENRTDELFGSAWSAEDFDYEFPYGAAQPANVSVEDNVQAACAQDVVVHCETSGADAYTYIVYETNASGTPVNSTVYTTPWYAGNLNQNIDFANLTYTGTTPSFTPGSYYGVKVGAGNCTGIWADDAAIVYINPASAYLYPTATASNNTAFLHVGNYGGEVVGWQVSYTTPPSLWINDAGLGYSDQTTTGVITNERSYRARIECGGFEYYSNYRTLDVYEPIGPGGKGKSLSSAYLETASLFPNPTKGRFTIQLSELPVDEELRLEIYNALGMKVAHHQSIGDNSINLNLTDQANGVYIVKMVIGNQIRIEKTLKE